MSQLKPLQLLKQVLRAPNGIRTRVTAVKGRCPRPLDDGDVRGSPILPATKQVTKPAYIAQRTVTRTVTSCWPKSICVAESSAFAVTPKTGNGFGDDCSSRKTTLPSFTPNSFA